MRIGILKETQKGEKRVSISPKVTEQLIDKGFELIVEKDAGAYSSYKNSDYIEAGARLEERGVVFKDSQMLIKINPFNEEDLKLVNKDQVLISHLYHKSKPELIQKIAAKGASDGCHTPYFPSSGHGCVEFTEQFGRI